MAQIIKKNSDFKRQVERYKARLIKSWLVRGLDIVLFILCGLVFHVEVLLIYILLIVVFAINECFYRVVSYRYDILRAGIDGEKAAAQTISKCLPRNYYAFQNVKVTYDGKTSEIDMVVVGKTGVYIIEIKNHKGTIIGNSDAKYWEQRKVGEGGTPYSEEFYSPVKQVGTHVYRLANHLRKNGIRVHVDAMVYFSNPEAVVRVVDENAEVPVFAEHNRGGEELGCYISEREQTLSDEMIKRIYRLLNE